MKESRPLLIWGIVRIFLGLIFLWAFFDKLLGLGFATTTSKSWLAGGSPTYGFLAMGVHGPLAGFYHSIASSELVAWLFMIGLLFIGLSLTFGIFMRLGCTAGILLLLMMWSALLPPANHPFIDEHVIYALVLLGLLYSNAGQALGFGHRWARLSLVKKFGLLK